VNPVGRGLTPNRIDFRTDELRECKVRGHSFVGCSIECLPCTAPMSVSKSAKGSPS
jgi:hypothetical protein